MRLNQDTHISNGQTWEFEWVCWQHDDKITRRKMAGNHGWCQEPTHRYMSDISWGCVFLHCTLSTNQNHQPTEESQNQSGEKNETQSWSNLFEFSQDGSEHGSVTCLASTLLTRNRSLGGSPPPDEKIGQLPDSLCCAAAWYTRPMGCLIKIETS